VAEIVDPAPGLDLGGELCRLPLAVAEVVQVEVAAPLGWEEQRALGLDGWRSMASNAIACSGTARRLASVFVHLSDVRRRLRALGD
jgi:hypothetical protein